MRHLTSRRWRRTVATAPAPPVPVLLFTLVFVFAVALAPAAAHSQAPGMSVSRAEAIETALRRAPRTAVARADSMAAAALVVLARQRENPVFGASYSESTPQAHFSLDIPVNWPSARAPRIAAARAGLDAATLRFAYARAALALDADTTYTRAQAHAARAALAARTLRDADSLLVLARVRRDAGDASELDVELATIFAGQAANAATRDSLAAVAARLALQSLMGSSADSMPVGLADSLELSSATVATSTRIDAVAPPGNTASLLVVASELESTAASARLRAERRRRLAAPSLSVGVETGNPGGPHGALPTVGIALPLPLFNRNDAAILAAQAEADRARASARLARLDASLAVAGARREASAARARVERSRRLVASADRIATLSLLAYREGAATLSSALEAQRSARETLAQFIDDVAQARIAESVLRLHSLTSFLRP